MAQWLVSVSWVVASGFVGGFGGRQSSKREELRDTKNSNQWNIERVDHHIIKVGEMKENICLKRDNLKQIYMRRDS